MAVYERFNPSYPHISLGWVVCSVEQAEETRYEPKKEDEPCGHWFILYEGQWYTRPDTYVNFSPYDWKKIDVSEVPNG